MAGQKRLPIIVTGVESVGRLVCESTRITVQSAAAAVRRACGRIRKLSAPAARDISIFLKGLVLTPVRGTVGFIRGVSETRAQFKRRRELFGAGKAFSLGMREIRTAG